MHIKVSDSKMTAAMSHTAEVHRAIATAVTEETIATSAPSIIMAGSNAKPLQLAAAETSVGDPFEESGEPTIYMSHNRMPVVLEISNFLIYIIFAALLLALVSILPGIRRTKLLSFLGLVTIIFVGASILLSIQGSHWLTSELQLYELPYGALTSESISGKLRVNIGLKSTNVTLFGNLMGVKRGDNGEGYQATSKPVDYNERFHWDEPDRMALEHVDALRRGLPYPILTVTEFLSQDSSGFSWMRQLRQAGYFASLALYASMASWCLTTVVMCALPVYLPHMMQITGALIMSSVWIYTLLIQSPKSFIIQLGEYPMEFSFGYTYVMTFVAGAVSMLTGALMFILQFNNPQDQMTIMDCDDFSNNRKALNLSTGYANNNSEKQSKVLPAQFLRANCVVIPIADIEQKFKHPSVDTKVHSKL